MKFVQPAAGVPAVVIVTFNNESDIRLLLQDLRACALSMATVVCVDNGSSDRTVEILSTHDTDVVVHLRPDNPGYAAGINTAVSLLSAPGPILILNPDLRLLPQAVERLVGALDEEGVGVSVPRILDGAESTYPSLRREPSVRRAFEDALLNSEIRKRFNLGEVILRDEYYANPISIDWATGAALCVRADVIRKIGSWDERYFLYSEETDWCRRVRELGWEIRYQPDAVVQHAGGGSGTSSILAALMTVNRVRYISWTYGKSSGVAVWAASIVNVLLRIRRPGSRVQCATLLRPASWSGLPARIRGVVSGRA